MAGAIIAGPLQVEGNLNVWTSSLITSAGIVSAAEFRDYTFSGSKILVSDASKSVAESSVASSQVTYLTNVSADIQTQINQVKQYAISGAGAGTPNTLVKFLTSTTMGDAKIRDDGSTIYFDSPTSGATSTSLTANARTFQIASQALTTYGTALPSYSITQTMGTNDQWRIYGEGGSNAGALFIETGDDATESINLAFRNTSLVRTTPYTFNPTTLSAPSVTATFGGLNVGNVSNEEISHLDGVTSNIQTQLNGKPAISDTVRASSYDTNCNLEYPENNTIYSFVGSKNVTSSSPFGNAYYNTIDVRHRNGSGDGLTGYGGQLVWGMTNYKNRIAFRTRNISSWESWTEIWTNSNLPITATHLTGTTSNIQTQLNGKVGTNAWNNQTIDIASAPASYFSDVATGDLAVRFGTSANKVALGVYNGVGNNKAAITYSKDSVSVGYQLNLTTSGIKFPDNAFGGGGDSAGMRLISRSGEDQSLELYVANDITDWINLIGPDNNFAKVNGNTIWNAGNFTPGNYLPLTGGTMTGNITFSDADEGVIFRSGAKVGNIGGVLSLRMEDDNDNPRLLSNNELSSWSILTTRNVTTTTNYIPKFVGTSVNSVQMQNSLISDDGASVTISGSVIIPGEGKGVILPSQDQFAPSAKFVNESPNSTHPASLQLYNNSAEQTVWRVYAQQSGPTDTGFGNNTLFNIYPKTTFHEEVTFSNIKNGNMLNASIKAFATTDLTASNSVSGNGINYITGDVTWQLPLPTKGAVLRIVGADDYTSPVANQIAGTYYGCSVAGNSKNGGMFDGQGPFAITGRAITLIGRDSSTWVVEGVAPW